MKIELTNPVLRFVRMADIRDTYEPGPGAHWFDQDTMRFFQCRLPEYGVSGPGGTFFVSSEVPPHGRRGYAVRQLTGPGSIRTIGEVCQYPTRKQAEAVACRMAQGGGL